MAGSTRIKGNKLALQFGTPKTDYWADTTSVTLENEESDDDVLTFEDAAGTDSGVQWFFTLSAIQSTSADSFWRYLWENSGETVPFTYAPHGNEEASASEPHFIGNCKIGPKPSVGGEAARTGGSYTFEARLDVEGTPVMEEGA